MSKNACSMKDIGDIIEGYGLKVTILKDRPYIGIVKGYKDNGQDEALMDLTAILKVGGVLKIIYDFSDAETDSLCDWILQFDATLKNKLHIEARYIGLNTKEINPKLLNKEYSFHKNIAKNLEYAVWH
jgi:hypothetical protein